MSGRTLVTGLQKISMLLLAQCGMASAQPVPRSAVLGWGWNAHGQLGNAAGNPFVSTPSRIPDIDNVRCISGGADFTIALKRDGTVWVWGNNSFGQLGNGVTANSNTAVQVTGLTDVIAVSASHLGEFALALKSDGTVWGWGFNSRAMLGNGTTTNSTTPVQVTGLTGVMAIAAAGYHGLALKGDGTVWAWGQNAQGELGDGTTTNRSTPVQVSGLSGVTAIAQGGYHSLALKNDGTVWAWGYNLHGELGNGASTNSNTPVQVTSLANVTALAAGGFHSLALKNDGSVWAWGYNIDGQLGDGTTTNSATPVQVPGLTGVKAIAAGVYYSLALKGGSSVWAWGDNAYGELGDGSFTNRLTPQALDLGGFATVAAGSFHGLALALPADLTIEKSHTGNFYQGQQGAIYFIIVSNGDDAGPTSGTVTVTETLPAGLTLASMTGSQWSCSGNVCTRDDALSPGDTYEPITVTVNVAPDAGSSLDNHASVSGGGSASADVDDPTKIAAATLVTIQTSPAGLQFSMDNGPPQTAPQTLYLTRVQHILSVMETQPGQTGTQYVFTGWSDGGMSAMDIITVTPAPVTYAASFKTQYQLTISASPAEGGTVMPSSGFFDANASQQITATPNANYGFASWTGNVINPSSATTTVNMAAPETVAANFLPLSGVTIQTDPTGLLVAVDGQTARAAPFSMSLSQGPHTIAASSPQAFAAGQQYAYASWSDGGAQSHVVTVGSTLVTYTASFKAQYQLTISASPAAGGTVTPASGGYYDAGTSVSITAQPNSGYVFSGWMGNVASGSAATTVTMSAPETVVANFTPLTSITIQTNAPGLLFSLNGGTPQTAPQTLNLSPGQYGIAVAATQPGTSGTQYVFTSWSDGGAASHSITVTASAAVYTATFKTQYQLTLSASPVNGGTVTPASGGFYDANSAVSINATANPGFSFGSWTGSVTNANNASTTVTMSAPEMVVANFASVTAITIQTSPPGLQFTLNGGVTQPAPQTLNLTPGQYTIAVAAAQPGPSGTQYVFTGWSDSGAAAHSITVGTTAATYTAAFKTQYQLTLSASPAAGGVVTPASGGFYDANSVVTISATPNPGYAFVGWTGTTGGEPSTMITMNAARTVVANFASQQTVVNVTSSMPNGSYAAGAGILIQVTFTGPVTVNIPECFSNSCTPRLTLNSGGTALYSSGSGTNILTFTYTVGQSDLSNRLDYTGTDALVDGIYIFDLSGVPINPALPVPGSAGSLGANSNIVITGQCAFSLSSVSAQVPSGAGSFIGTSPSTGVFLSALTGTFTLTAAHCTASDQWTATSNTIPVLAVANGAFTSGMLPSFSLTGNGSTASIVMGFAMLANTSSSVRPGTITISGTQSGQPFSLTFTVTQAASVDQTLARVVRALYQTILGREPDSAGFNFWTGPGAPSSNGAVLANEMADDFYRSAEFGANGWEVMSIYQAATGRTPSYSQWINAVTPLRPGSPQAPSVESLLDSLTGTVSNTAFVQTVILNSWGRAPIPSELSQFVAQLTNSNSPTARLDFLNSTVFANSLFTSGTNAAWVKMLYFTILVRDPDASGLSFWVGVSTNPPGEPGFYYEPGDSAAAYQQKLYLIGQAVPPNPAFLGFLGSPEFQGLIQ